MSLLHLDGELAFDVAGPKVVNELLRREHYLGPMMAGGLVFAGYIDGHPVAVQVWRTPTSRWLPADGTWLELSRWCLTPAAGEHAGSRMHSWAIRYLRHALPEVTTLVSYSDPSVGHTGALYRACSWVWAPTWHRLEPPPSQGGSWDGETIQAVKDRWVFPLRRDRRRRDVLAIDYPAALRRYLDSDEWHETTSRWRSTLRGDL